MTKHSPGPSQRFKQLADRKIQIGEEELRAIVEDESEEPEDRVRLVSLHVFGGNDVTPTADVQVEMEGSVRRFRGEGDGMIHAAFAALRHAFGSDARLVDYRVEPVTAGADAMAEVNVVVQTDGATYRGHGVHTDVVEASAEAFCNALNRAARVAQRRATSPPVPT